MGGRRLQTEPGREEGDRRPCWGGRKDAADRAESEWVVGEKTFGRVVGEEGWCGREREAAGQTGTVAVAAVLQEEGWWT